MLTLFEYLERKELLKKPAEQERLLLEVPNVIAEELEPEAVVQEPAEDEKNDGCGLPQLDIVGNRADIPFDIEADKSLSNDDFCSTDTTGLHMHDLNSLDSIISMHMEINLIYLLRFLQIPPPLPSLT